MMMTNKIYFYKNGGNTLNADIISEVVRELIGEIKPCGDSAIDKERRTNLHKLIHVMDVLLDDVCEITTQRDRKEGSICQMVDMVEDAIMDWHDSIEDYMGVSSAYAHPTAEPEQKKGVWKFGFNNQYLEKYYYCSKCGSIKYMEHKPLDNFCANCGADMRAEV